MSTHPKVPLAEGLGAYRTRSSSSWSPKDETHATGTDTAHILGATSLLRFLLHTWRPAPEAMKKKR